MNIQNLREQRLRLYNQMKDIVNDAKNEKRGLKPDEQQQFDNAEADMKNIEGDIRRLEALQERSSIITEKREIIEDFHGKGSAEELIKRRHAAFNKYLRGQQLTSEERNILQRVELRGTSTQVVGTDSLGGYTVPQGFGDIDIATAFVSDLGTLASTMVTQSGNKIPFPTVNDTATTANSTAEGSGVTVQDITFTEKELDAYDVDTLVKVSVQLAQDNGVDLGQIISELAAERIKRKENAWLTTGTGSSQPQGVITGATVGKTAASATAFTAAELLDLYYSVDKSYRANAKFMCNDAIHSYIRNLALTAAQDAPVVTVNPMTGDLMINGKGVEVNNDMASTVATTNKTVLFGDFKKFRVRRVQGVTVMILRERYMDEKSIGYLVFTRVDSVVADTRALKVLQQA